MGKVVRIEDGQLAKALVSGAEYLIVGHRRFRLIEVKEDEPEEEGFYEPTDSEEIRALEEALHDKSELLDAEEGRKFLKEQLRQHGIS